ncbi:MAG TPA: DUF448 domain-containing protein [Candidatus Baltobacteraceae bacterium]|nr:DUF448 domain-containing protein [Candidatus Baltobacteraceae bacterium]
MPIRTCVVCRVRLPQAELVRFSRSELGWLLWTRGIGGRGAYLCSQKCAGRVGKNRRYAALTFAADEAIWVDHGATICGNSSARV